jgi:predicted outer membrane repeat protein
MKKYLGIIKTAAVAALGLLLFAACVNILAPPRQQAEGYPDGKGAVRIETGAAAARTALPAKVFDHYEFSFSKDQGPFVPLTPSGGDSDALVFELESGDWSVEVKAYVGPEPETLAATGNADFTIIGGEEVSLEVKLSPVASEGSGTLNYTLRYPGGAKVRAFTLTRIAEETAFDFTGGETITDNPFTGTHPSASGYYLARASLAKDGIIAEKTEVVHIYKNMTTELELAFNDLDFKALLVTSSADSGPGSLRQVIEDAPNNATILIDLPEHDRVITLSSGGLAIDTKSLTIEGNGATLTQSGIPSGVSSQLLRLSGNANTFIFIRRLHFKGGRADNGAAIYNSKAKLFLESCIFNDNRASARGGAIYGPGAIAIRGCTFYGNSAGIEGGAVYSTSADAFLVREGNLFWGNTAPSYPVYVTSSGSGGSQIVSRVVAPLSFRPLKDSPALNAISVRPEFYPELDFYGAPIPAENVTEGAVQSPVQGDGFVLDYAPVGSGEVAVAGLDADGLAAGDVTLTASNGAFGYWTIDGTKQEDTSPVLIVNMDGLKTVRAFFNLRVTSAANDGPGSLRQTLAGAASGDTIVLPAGQTIVLTTVLPNIAKNIVIDGNGATLTQRGITPGAATQLLRINTSTTVSIRRLHFTGARTTSNGGAVYNQGTLTLESCIFSDNVNTTTSTSNGGGAVYTSGILTIRGCTFYKNSAGGCGGAVYKSGSTAFALIGNVFWGNTAALYPVVRSASVSVTSGGYNVADVLVGAGDSATGYALGTGDKQVPSLPFSFAGFRPIAGLKANGLEGVITERPEGYPELDFYGDPIPAENAAAGVAQTAVTAGAGYILDCAPVGPGTVTPIVGTVDPNGFTEDPSVTLRAEASGNGKFEYWTINGTQQPGQSPELVVAMDGHKTVRAIFSTAHRVTSVLDSGAGSLREALANAGPGDTILLPENQTITLTTVLPNITSAIVIEGNGATLTQNGFVPSTTSQLLHLSSTAVVRVSRLHFKGGRTTGYGGAVYNQAGNLTLESCIFSDNINTTATADYGGGAVYTSGILTVSGCTFFGNTTTGNGGAILKTGTTAFTLTGNVFRDNAAASYPVVYLISGSVVSGSNVSDKPSDNSAENSGWSFQNGDKQAMFLPVSPVSFRPISDSEALNMIGTKPGSYPEKDFYGVDIQFPAAAGAAQTPTETGYVLDYVAIGRGTVSAPEGALDDDGLASAYSAITLTAAPVLNGVFDGWTVNGTPAGDQTPVLVVTMDGHKIVRAVFSISLTVISVNDSGIGTLREALTNAYDGGMVVLPEGKIITLYSPLPEITKSIIIEGNGTTLTQEGFTASQTSQLLYISSSSAVVSISRLHFMGGRATTYGAAIRSLGTLTLESCIFSENQTTNASASGGALCNIGNSITVSGCTFYGNTAGNTGGGNGAAILTSNAILTLTGNIFWANTPTRLVYRSGSASMSSSYNVFDQPGNQVGWGVDSTDKYLTNLSLMDFKPYSTELPAISLPLAGFPSTYFDGTSRGSSSVPGAMPFDDPNAGSGDPGDPGPVAPPSGPQDFSIPPSQPAGLKSVPGMKMAYLSWFPAARAESYEVYYSTGTDFGEATKFTEEPTEPKATVTGLEYSTAYNFWVKAKNPSGSRLSLMFTAPRKTADPVPAEFIHNGETPSIFGDGDFYWFTDSGPGTAPDERYRMGYSFFTSGGAIKFVRYIESPGESTGTRGVLIYREAGEDSDGNPNGRYQATYYWYYDPTYPPQSVMGQANGYLSGMGNDQRTDTLEEAVDKFDHLGGYGIKGGMHEYIAPMNVYYRFVEE